MRSSAVEKLQDLEPSVAEFRRAVIEGLSSSPKTLPCKFFYDAAGSHLFDQICELPEYYPTRTEFKILKQYAGAIARHLGSAVRVVEFGSGAGVKIRILLAALDRPACYIPVDISRDHLLAAAASLADDFPDLHIAPICADYTQPFALPATRGPAMRVTGGFFPGTTIGNFNPAEARTFLARARRLLGPDSTMIVGVDIPKDEATLHAAYDDAAGVTAAFNLNLLHRINRELEGTFDLSNFRHEARWNRTLGRIEMHLVSLRTQTVGIGDRRFDFGRGESIHTENSYKYSVAQFQALAHNAGYVPADVWTDENNLFSVHLLRAGAERFEPSHPTRLFG